MSQWSIVRAIEPETRRMSRELDEVVFDVVRQAGRGRKSAKIGRGSE